MVIYINMINIKHKYNLFILFYLFIYLFIYYKLCNIHLKTNSKYNLLEPII